MAVDANHVGGQRGWGGVHGRTRWRHEQDGACVHMTVRTCVSVWRGGRTADGALFGVRADVVDVPPALEQGRAAAPADGRRARRRVLGEGGG